MSEREQQIAVFDCLRLNESLDPRIKWIYASMNGLYSKSARMAADRKRQGQRSGISDICLPFPSLMVSEGSHAGRIRVRPKEYGGYIEMKVSPNKATTEQTAFIQFLRSQNYAVIVAYSADEALDFIELYLNQKLRGRK